MSLKSESPKLSIKSESPKLSIKSESPSQESKSSSTEGKSLPQENKTPLQVSKSKAKCVTSDMQFDRSVRIIEILCGTK